MPRAKSPARKSSKSSQPFQKGQQDNISPEDSGPGFEEWARLAELQPIPLILADGEGQILLANAAAQALLGYTRQELEGRTLGETVAVLDELRDCEAVTVSTGAPCELDITRGDGQTRTVVGRLIETPWFDAPSESASGCALWLQDITTWTAQVEEVDESDAADESEHHEEFEASAQTPEFEQLSELLPAAVQELKNPLSSLLVMVELLLEDTPENESREDLTVLMAELRRMQLAFEGLACGTRELRSTRTSAIDQALRETLEVFSTRFESAALNAAGEVQDMPALPFDPAGVRAIAFHLLSNALQSCPRGAEVRLFAQLDSEHDVLEMGVSDTGPGMTAEVRERCSEPFFSTQDGGSGLGLSLVQQAVERAAGELWVDSEEGRGSTLLVRLPLAQPASQSASAED